MSVSKEDKVGQNLIKGNTTELAHYRPISGYILHCWKSNNKPVTIWYQKYII